MKLGRGRAYLLVKDHYDPSFRDPILHACLHNLAYDRQIEGTRGWYMYTIIHATNDFAFYRDAIYTALLNLTADADDYDIEHIYRLAANIAEDGDTEMREAITQIFQSTPAFGDFVAAKEIIRLDGLEGFIYVAEYLSEQIRQNGPDFILGEHTYNVDISLMFPLEEEIGDEEAKAALERLRSERPSIIPVLDAIDEWRKPPKRRRETKSRPAYSKIKQIIHSSAAEISTIRFRSWGKTASDEEFLQAAQDLLIETDPKCLYRYLGIFEKRAFPLDHTPIIKLAQHPDGYVSIHAINALEQIEHPTVRAFALESIERGYKVGRVVSLLQRGNNYLESDWAIIEPLTRQVTDEDDLHSLGFGIREIFDQHPTPLAIPSLLNMYQYGPCGSCREHFVDNLAKLDAIPDWLREEAQYDSLDYVRETIGKLTEGGASEKE